LTVSSTAWTGLDVAVSDTPAWTIVSLRHRLVVKYRGSHDRKRRKKCVSAIVMKVC